MADLVMGAMGNLIPKLYQLLKDEYKLQTGVKERLTVLTKELEGAQAALRNVAEVPWDQLDEQVKLWARELREASYDMEDVLDTFLVRIQGPADSAEQEKSLLKPLKKVVNLIKTTQTRRKISGNVKDIMAHLQEVTERCCRYKVHDIVAKSSTASTIDPRLHVMYNKVKDLVGIDEPSRELISMLQTPQQDDDASGMKVKIVSVVGVGGLGKTTLAKAVYDKFNEYYDFKAFVSVGRSPDMKMLLQKILIKLDKERYMKFNFAQLNDISEFIDELREFLLQNKRYFIVIDDIWEIQSWQTIKLSIDDDNNCGGRIIITTRKMEVATVANEVYKLRPLPYGICRELFFTRIYGDEARKYVDNQPDEISDKFIKKCGGIPLAIITMGSLLAGKQIIEWSELYNSIDFGRKGNKEAENTMKILSFSFYDLPSHLRTCLLYLSAFPEDSVIGKDSLVWKWVAEGFVCKEKEKGLFETGEGYFNDLINRSMLEVVKAVDHDNLFGSDADDSIIYGCRVHDVVLDFIRDMSREENFFTLWDNNNDEGRLGQRNIRRLVHHNKTSRQVNHTEMPSVRSVIAFYCVTDMWVSVYGFKLLRVLDIFFYSNPDHMEHLGQLLHLRFLRLSGEEMKKIPEEIGALKFLQTLDLGKVHTLEFPSSRCLPKQLVCLRVFIDAGAPNAEVFSVEGLTSLEELSIDARNNSIAGRRLAKQLSSLTELRVLDASFYWDDRTERELVESLRHLNKLQHVEISCSIPFDVEGTWQGSGFVFHRPLRHLAVEFVKLCKLPSCISPSRLPNLCHLDLKVKHVDDQDLKLLGKLPELYYLGLDFFISVRTAATISNVSDSDAAGYFPKLRFCILNWAMVFFIGNKESKAISFHLWSGHGDIPMPCASSGYDELQSGDELKSDDKSLGPMTSDCDDDEYIARHSIVSDDQNKGSICSKSAATPPPFMPRLQVLHFDALGRNLEDHRYFGNLGLEYLSSLQKIEVTFISNNDEPWGHSFNDDQEVVAMLEHAVKVHPNHPTLRKNWF